MAEQSELQDAVASIESPLFVGRTLGELGLVKDVSKKLTGRVRVRLLLPDHAPPDALDARLQEALDPFTSTADVEVEVMDEETVQTWMDGLKARSGPGIGEPGSATRVLAVSSGKGGVGKSSISANLAVALARTGRKVGIVDGDIWGFSIPRMLGIVNPPVMVGDMIVPPVSHRVKVMSMDFFVGDDKAVIWRGPMLHKAIEQFLGDVYWGELDFLLCDLPPGTGDVSISLASFLPGASMLVVTTPQDAARKVAERAGKMAERTNLRPIGVIENMSWYVCPHCGERELIFGTGGGDEAAETLGVPLLAQVPLVTELRDGGDRGKPIVVNDPDGPASLALRDAAQKIAQETRSKVRKPLPLMAKPGAPVTAGGHHGHAH